MSTAVGDYRTAVRRLEQRPRLGTSAGLERTQALLTALDEPQRSLSGVLVAGTNGKGSVCALIDSICRAHGMSTVLLTKPHLVEWRERIATGGEPISERRFTELAVTALAAAERMDQSHGEASRIEILTAMGLLAAAENRPDVLVCEVGVGGRLDSTNVLDLGIAVITNVGTDHRELLGQTERQIAIEKAAIIKPGNLVVTAATGVALEAISAAAGAAQAPLQQVRHVCAPRIVARHQTGSTVAMRGPGRPWELSLPLPGDHQASNLAAAVMVAAQLVADQGRALNSDCLAAGVGNVRWPGRLQFLKGRPELLLDAAHNPEAMAALVSTLPRMAAGRRVAVVFGALADKEIELMLPWIARMSSCPVMTTVPSPRAAEAVQLAARFGNGAIAVNDPAQAIEAASALCGSAGVVVVCGSLALVGAVLRQRRREAAT